MACPLKCQPVLFWVILPTSVRVFSPLLPTILSFVPLVCPYRLPTGPSIPNSTSSKLSTRRPKPTTALELHPGTPSSIRNLPQPLWPRSPKASHQVRLGILSPTGKLYMSNQKRSRLIIMLAFSQSQSSAAGYYPPVRGSPDLQWYRYPRILLMTFF